jgi:hypothetical protein
MVETLPAQLLKDCAANMATTNHPNKDGVAKHFLKIVNEKAFGKPFEAKLQSPPASSAP